MGILDDLKQQAEKQQNNTRPGNDGHQSVTEDFYRDQVKARMLAAYDFLSELVNQVNGMKLDIRAKYPFKPEGKAVTLLQRGYKVYNDHITDPRQITLAFHCSLANPTIYEISDRGAVLAQSELLDRYHFKYERQDQKDARQMLTGARFKLTGPLPIKVVLQFDESRQVIKLLLTNFAGPGTSQYHLSPEKLDEAFLDHLGKYLLRKETALFKQEISDDMKVMLRKKLEQEKLQRDAELQQMEEARKAEEALRKQNSTREQLKKAVSHTVTENTDKLKKAMNEQLKRVMHTQVAKGKESLKGIFDKLKKQTQAPQQTPPAQPHQQVTAKTVRSAPAGRQIPQPITAEPARVASSKSASPASPPAAKTATVKKTQPPKVYNAPPNNPFLKPEPPVDTTEREAKTATAQPKLEATPVAHISSSPKVTAKTQEADPANVNNAALNNPFLIPEPSVDADQQEVKTASAPQELEATMVIDISSHPELSLKPLDADDANVNNAASTNPFLTPESPVEPPVDLAEREAKAATAPLELEPIPVADIAPPPEVTPELSVEPPVDAAEREVKSAAAQPELEAPPVTDSSSRPDLTPEALEADLARIIERDKQNMPQSTPDSNKTTNPFLQTPSTKEAAQTAMPAVGIERARTNLKPGELNTDLSDVMPKTREAVSAKEATAPEATNATHDPVLKPEELEIDLDIGIAGDVVPPQNNDAKENS